jgi:AP-3 complex subunit beta
LLSRHLAKFFVRANDLLACKQAKIQILSCLITPDNVDVLISEFRVCHTCFFIVYAQSAHATSFLYIQDYASDTEDNFVSDAIQAIGKCAKLVPDSREKCLSVLLELIRSPHGKRWMYSP